MESACRGRRGEDEADAGAVASRRAMRLLRRAVADVSLLMLPLRVPCGREGVSAVDAKLAILAVGGVTIPQPVEGVKVRSPRGNRGEAVAPQEMRL